jgi:hypothetical protein
MHLKIRLCVAGLICAALLAGCGATPAFERGAEPDMQEVAKLLNCPSFSKATCVAQTSGPYSCFCMDEDAVRAILEPDKYY